MFKPAFVVKAMETGKIWSDEHAKRRCTRLAEQNDGTWSGVWRDAPNGKRGSVCMITVAKDAHKPTHQTTPISFTHVSALAARLKKRNRLEYAWVYNPSVIWLQHASTPTSIIL